MGTDRLLGRVANKVTTCIDKFYVPSRYLWQAMAAPFSSMAKVNNHGAFNARQSILLRAGAIFGGALTPACTGEAGHPITIGRAWPACRFLFNITTSQQPAGVVIAHNHGEDVAGWSNKAGPGNAELPFSAGIMVWMQGSASNPH